MTMVIGSIGWFLYLAGVADKVNGITHFFGVMLAVICVLGTLAVCILRLVATTEPEVSEEMPPIMKMYKWFIACGLVCGVIYSTVPARDTMYAMAAAEVGEKIVNSEKVQGVADDATKALQAWLRHQIEKNSNEHKDK